MWLEIINKTNGAICIQDNLAYYMRSNNSLSVIKLKLQNGHGVYIENIYICPFQKHYIIFYYMLQMES